MVFLRKRKHHEGVGVAKTQGKVDATHPLRTPNTLSRQQLHLQNQSIPTISIIDCVRPRLFGRFARTPSLSKAFSTQLKTAFGSQQPECHAPDKRARRSAAHCARPIAQGVKPWQCVVFIAAVQRALATHFVASADGPSHRRRRRRYTAQRWEPVEDRASRSADSLRSFLSPAPLPSA